MEQTDLVGRRVLVLEDHYLLATQLRELLQIAGLERFPRGLNRQGIPKSDEG